ncbi:stigma-specific STIG1-like protein 2 [Mangifera indica]|uniref:stigma-specific STIG1-like protein 2 n=1 Tax=Mangifera indica TaxID=29780 RepID=UPI001CFABE93|nr:stigma-specific STIG1-like protein 2 [Mangifera indica]
MELINIILSMAITMAITITLIMQNIGDIIEKTPSSSSLSSSSFEHRYPSQDNTILFPTKRGSRFLSEVKNPRAADHCHKDNEVCYAQGKNTTCCNNKCMNLKTDENNCGACKKKCKYTEACCRGECVNLSFDKRHCGYCNNRCLKGEYCVYGLCDYA